MSNPSEIGVKALMASGELALTARPLEDPGTPEAALVARCRRGDAQAFETLVGLHERMVFGLSARLLGDPEEARDVSQEVFLQVFRSLRRFQGRSSLRTWIYRIAVNLCRNRRRFWHRRARYRSCGLDDLSQSEQLRLSEPGGESPYEVARRRERSRRVQAALMKLKFDHRLVLLLREAEGLGCEEIAQTLDIATGTVKSRLARARDAFRRVFEPEEDIP